MWFVSDFSTLPSVVFANDTAVSQLDSMPMQLFVSPTIPAPQNNSILSNTTFSVDQLSLGPFNILSLVLEPYQATNSEAQNLNRLVEKQLKLYRPPDDVVSMNSSDVVDQPTLSP